MVDSINNNNGVPNIARTGGTSTRADGARRGDAQNSAGEVDAVSVSPEALEAQAIDFAGQVRGVLTENTDQVLSSGGERLTQLAS